MAGKQNAGQKRARKTQARKKKQQQKAKRASQQKTAVSSAPAPPSFFDRRLMERDMAGMFGQGRQQTAAESKADELFYLAIEANNEEDRYHLLEDALEANPRHIDALVERTEYYTPDEAIPILERAVEFGAEDLHRELQEDVGYFWSMLHTRPYMRARLALAVRCSEVGDLDAAAREYEDMLRLNPNDNQGVRWNLMETYCRLDRFDDAERLLERYPDEALPFLPFTGLLLRFRKEGDSPELREDLREEAQRHPHLVPRLLNPHLINHDSPGHFAFGSPEEADIYCRQFLSAWKSTPGAITWLRSASRDFTFADDDRDTDCIDVIREIQKLRQRVKALDSCDEVWYCDADYISEDEDAEEGWLLTLLTKDDTAMICIEPGEDPLCTDTLLYGILNAMLEPEDGEPRRPAAIEFADSGWQRELSKRLERLGIDSSVADERPEVLDFIEQSMAAASGRVEFDLEELRATPISTSHWEIDWRQIDQWLPDEETGESVQPWMTLIVDDENFVLSQQLSFSAPDRETLLTAIGQAVLTPAAGRPSRPAKLLVPSADHQVDVKSLADDIGVKCVVDRCDAVKRAFDSLIEHLSDAAGGGPPALVSLPGVTPEMVGDLYEASADFYRSRVWTRMPPETIVEVTCPDLLPGRWYSVLMGQMGEAIGIIFFDDQRALQAVFASDHSNPESGAETLSGLSYSLQEQEVTHPADVAAAEQFGWPVPAPEAWPGCFRVGAGKLSSVEAAELKFLAAGIRAVTEHYRARKEVLETTVQLAGETVLVETRDG